MAQVRDKKRSCTGAILGEGLPPQFGLLLDYARRLDYSSIPDYFQLREDFRNCSNVQLEVSEPLPRKECYFGCLPLT